MHKILQILNFALRAIFPDSPFDLRNIECKNYSFTQNKLTIRYNFKYRDIKNTLFKFKYLRCKSCIHLQIVCFCDSVYAEIASEIYWQNIKQVFLLPTPARRARIRSVNFDHNMEISKALSNYMKEKGIKAELIKARYKKTIKAQHKLKRSERFENVSEAFCFDTSEKLKLINNKNDTLFVIFDDISTTGASLISLRNELKKLGVPDKKIFLFALAH